ncbi:MAG TPA: hypothetical protein ENL18_01735, partial [Thermoplasmatales archaeon]|nr:hypothetical protein [Thermoplasmatales archaeon]
GAYALELTGKFWKYEGVDRFSAEDKGQEIADMEDFMAIYDALGVCKFSRGMFLLDGFAELLEAAIGKRMGGRTAGCRRENQQSQAHIQHKVRVDKGGLETSAENEDSHTRGSRKGKLHIRERGEVDAQRLLRGKGLGQKGHPEGEET